MHSLCPKNADFSRIAVFSVLLLPFSPQGKGIEVKFLPSPAEDNIVRYELYRSETPGQTGNQVADLRSPPQSDTLSIPDTTAIKGVAYFYSLKSFAADGQASEFSSQSRVAHPLLTLPDTLTFGENDSDIEFTYGPAFHPLGDDTHLVLSHSDSAVVSVTVDKATGRLIFHAKKKAYFLRNMDVTASYYGKFSDQGTLVVTGGQLPLTFIERPTGNHRWTSLRENKPTFDVLGRLVSPHGEAVGSRLPGVISISRP